MIFHFLFYKMLNWGEALKALDNDNRSILLTYHYISILITGFMAFVAMFQAKQLLASQLKYSVLGAFALFYIIRIITEFTLFGLSGFSAVILPLCAIPAACFLIPLFKGLKE